MTDYVNSLTLDTPKLSLNISNNIIEEINILMETIADDFNIKHSDFNNKYFQNISKITNILSGKKRTRRVLPKEMTCMGRKLDGEQCTRAKRSDTEFCLSHHKNLPNGRIDDLNYQPPVKGKRGRKKKVVYDASEYIATKLEILDGQKYLVDSDNNVYTYNLENPEWIGKKNDLDQIEYFYKE